jgi:hypothetical protein
MQLVAGMGSALTVDPIIKIMRDRGYESAFSIFGIAQGLVVILVAMIFRGPREGEVPSTAQGKVQQATRDTSPAHGPWIRQDLGCLPS